MPPARKKAAARPRKAAAASPREMTARAFVAKLRAKSSAKEREKIQRYFRSGAGEYGEGDVFLGVRMGDVFALAKEHAEMPLDEVEALLESEVHEARAGAFSLMGKSYAARRTTEERREALVALCLRRTDRMNNWDLVDLAGLYVVGPHLADRPASVLVKLARSKSLWERRLAIVATAARIREGNTADTFRIAKMLLKDPEDLVHKATGWMLRFAGDVDRAALLAFLAQHAPTMPRAMLRAAIEKLPKAERARLLARQA